MNWQEVPGAASYELVIYNVETGQEAIRQIIEGETTHKPDFWWKQGGSYQAFVRAIGADGQTSGWSSPQSFQVEGPQGLSPSFVPTAGSDGTSRKVTWQPMDAATRYEVVVYDVETGQQVYQSADVTESEVDLDSDLKLPKGRYQVFTRGINAAGEAGLWGTPLEFDLPESSHGSGVA